MPEVYLRSKKKKKMKKKKMKKKMKKKTKKKKKKTSVVYIHISVSVYIRKHLIICPKIILILQKRNVPKHRAEISRPPIKDDRLD